jgi:hypothetical protein
MFSEEYVTHYCTIVDQVSRKFNNDFSFPAACTIRFKFAARGNRPPVDLFWYDGGMRPRNPEELEAEGKDLPAEGILFVGDQGKIIAGFTGQSPQIYPKSRSDAVNLGAIAVRAGKKVLFDSENMKTTNVAEANKYLYREYRKGWEL